MRFEIQAPDGKVFEIEGDAIPTETELNNIFSAMSSQESINNISKPSVDITKVKASDMMGEQGFDNKPFEKLNNYIQKITEVKVNEDVDYSIKDAWEGFKNNLFKFEVRKSNEKPEGAQVLEDTAVEALDVGKQYAEATKKAVVNADIKDLGKGTKEVSKALGRATAEFTIGGVGKVVSMVGDLMYDETDITNMSKFEANKIKSGNFTAETYKKIGRYLQDLSDMAVQSDILKEDPEIFSGSFVENPSLTRLVSFGASAVPSLFTAGGLHKLGVPNKLNGMILAGLESSDVYGEAREAGKGKGEALGLFALSSAGTAYLETKGLDNLFDNKMKSLAGRMLTTMGSEGFTEYWQTVYQNAVKKYGYDATQDLFEGGFEALIGGIIGGGGAQVVNTSFDKFSKRADKYGVTQEEKMAILNAVSNETNAKSEQLNAMFQSNYDKSMKTLEEYINTNKDEAAVAQAVEKKQQLEKIYNDTYNELKNIMPEQEAKSNAALIRNSAFFYANEFGISPEEFIKKRGVKVVKSDYEQFKGNKTTEDMPIMQVTQKDLNYARSHPEWKSNARIIEMIGQAGADINDDINTINKALKQYSIEENKFRKEKEDAQYNLWAKDLDEAKQERYAMMVENGVKPQDAYNAVTYVEDYIPFQTGVAEIDNSQLYQNLPQNIRDAVDFVFNTDAIKEISGDEFQKDGIPLTDKVTKFYEDKYNGKAYNPELGEVKLDREGVKDSLGHGIGSKKAAAYALVPEVIEKGFIFNRETNWKGRGYDTAVLIAPVKIGGEDYICEVVVKQGAERQGFYLHEVELTKKLADVFKTANGSTPTSFKLIISQHINNVKKNMQSQGVVRFQESLDVAKVNAELDKVNPAYEGETIDIDGVERTVYNSNGDRIAMSEPALRNFYNWFGDSKVVDEQGRPLVVYHGTNKEFDSFNKKLLGTTTLAYSARQGFFFTDSEDVANSYGDYAAIYQPINELRKKQEMAERWGDWDTVDELTIKIEELDRKISQTPANERGQKIYPVYLKADNVLEYDAKGEYFSDIGDEINDVLLKAKNQGKDGVVLKNLKDQPLVFDEKEANHFVVFEPNQIKSTSNRGTFNPNDDRIYYQGGENKVYSVFDLKVGDNLKAFGVVEEINQADRQIKIGGEWHSMFMIDMEANRSGLTLGTKEEIDISDGTEEGVMKVATGDEAVLNKQRAKNEEYNTIAVNHFGTTSRLSEAGYILTDGRLLDFSGKKFGAQGGSRTLDHREVSDAFEDFNVSMEDFINSGNIRYMPEGDKILLSNVPTSAQYKVIERIVDNSGGNITIELMGDANRWGMNRNDFYNDYNDASYSSIKRDINAFYKGEGVRQITEFYQDGANDPKGAYVNRIIYLFQNADASTLPHELAHFWKDTLKDAAKMSKRAAKMLEDVEKWAEQEFNRKYSVQLKDGRYMVNNKQGFTVYDHNFRTEADAKEYAKEELFAQGNEAYLKEGVAPNNSLKQAFRNFLNWLKHIYNQAKQLDIRLSPEIRQVYADILGGTEIDFFLNTDPDTFVENRIKLATETVNTLDEQIAEAQRMGVSVSEPDGRGLKHVWETAMIPLSTRLGRVSNKLKNRLRRYEFDITNSLNHYYDEARPFLQKWKTFSEMDTIAFDIALKNDYVKKQLEIVDKYGAREEWEKVRKLLLDIFDSAVKAGLDVNFRPDYFPRKVKDVQGFLSYLRGRPEWTKFEEALRDADPQRTFTAEEQADFINKYLRGFVKVDLMPYKYGSEKQRSIEIINNEMNKYYAPSMESLVSYIEGMNARIEASKFLGRDAENLDASVGGYLDYLINNNEIDPNKVDEVKEILKARFNQKGVGNKWIAGARNISYMYTMGGINSAITQIEDLSVSMYKAGIWNTLITAFENKKIKRADLGLDKISAEFVDNPSRTARGVDKLFKLTGLDKIDSFGKETLVNAMVKKFKQMSEESLRQYIEPIMEQETTQTIQDIKNGEMSDNVLYLVFSELSDVQPISLSELPAFYNTSGNLRILYMLKSFMIKRIDIFRNECLDKLRSKNKEARIQGMQNLFKLALLMIFCGMSKDWLINMLYGRKMDIPEVVVNNALGLVGFSKFHAYQLRDKGAGEVIKDFLMPPMFAPYDDLLGDIWRIGRGKRDLKDAESFKGIPLVGRFYYWHIGRGREKMKKRNKSKLK